MKKRHLFVSAIAAVLAGGFFIGRAVNPLGTSAAPDISNPAIPQDAGQQAALADGTVTAAEYRAAFDQYVACATQAGAVVSGPVTTDRFGHLGVKLTMAGSNPDQLEQIGESCRRQHLDAVELAWVQAHPVSDADATAARNYTATCLIRAGFHLDAAPSKNALTNVIASNVTNADARVAIGTCLGETATKFNWPGYGGS